MTIILYNPLSKNRKSKRATKKLVDYYRKHNLPFRVKSLLKIHDLQTYLKNTPQNINIILLGGDGTINTFINNSINMELTHQITIKPTGSGNDFLRSLRKQRPTYQHIMKLKHNNKIRYFVNGAGMGIDGEIAHRVNQSKRKNRFNYLKNTFRTFFTYKPKYLEATLDDKHYTFKKAYLININNGAYVGGGMKLTPKAKLAEKKLDVLIVHNISKIALIFIFLSVYLGFHTIFKRYVFITKASYVKATMHSSQIAQCDGETFEDTQEIEVSLTHKKTAFKPF